MNRYRIVTVRNLRINYSTAVFVSGGSAAVSEVIGIVQHGARELTQLRIVIKVRLIIFTYTL